MSNLIRIKTVTAMLFLASLFLLLGCDSQRSAEDLYAAHRWSGETMGTYYRITIVEDADAQDGIDLTLVKQRVEQQLNEIIASMSTYEVDSEISQFNRLQPNQCLPVSQSLLDVVTLSLEINAKSLGAFNPLVAPLVERWGFGSSSADFVYPDNNEITRLLARADMSALSINDAAQSLCKSSDIALDLSAIAKGYAVDRIADQLAALSATNYLVDVGGELIVAGHNPKGEAWRLAIERPVFRLGEIEQLVGLTDVAIATSGDYRNFFEFQGKRYSHTIDVRTGYPVQHNLASVSVIADTAAEADAWATALTVLGEKQARQLVDEHGLAVYLIKRENSFADEPESTESEDAVTAWYSEQFSPYILQ
ncbi:MAG: FAD:protein FMN transferase [Pseudomonadales bacterium]